MKWKQSGPLFVFLVPALFSCAGSAPRGEGELLSGIRRARAELGRLSKPDGRFVYQYDALGKRPDSAAYNITRHAGTMYSLAMYEDRFPAQDTVELLRRSARYLLENAYREQEREGGSIGYVLASPPPQPGPGYRPYVSLGGAGLGLVGLAGAERLAPGSVGLPVLRRLGRFLLMMQKPDGDFFPKYYPETRERSEEGYSLYYPGESILAFSLLYQLDPNEEWRAAAFRSMSFLAESRRDSGEVPADNWALIASEQLWKLNPDPRQRKLIEDHAVKVVRSDLAFRNDVPASPAYGALDPRGFTTPTSTRLEGLLAACSFLPTGQEELRRGIADATGLAIRFLLRAQLSGGPHDGGIPAAVVDPGLARPVKRPMDVRVDFIQHALSAMLRARENGHCNYLK